MSTARQTDSGSVDAQTRRLSTAEANDLPRLIAEQADFQPRLLSSVSSVPRQEIRGGFPGNLNTEIRPPANISASDLITTAAANPPAFRNPLTPEMSSSARSLQVQVSAPPPPMLPAALPGLHIRLLRPEESPLVTERAANDATPGGRSISETSKAPAPSAAPPPLDINAVADRVYQVLQRRHRFERERSGLY
jgi:hypothetical protein